jgi:hypothetical protein
MFDLRTITATTYDENGFLGLQFEPLGDSEASAPIAHAHHPFGFFGRPLDPDTSENGTAYGPVAMSWSDGDEEHGLCLEDPRDSDKIPPHSKGSSGVYNSNGSFLLFDNEKQTTTLYSPFGSPVRAHLFTMGKDDNGKEIVELCHANDMGLTMLDRTVVLKNAGGTSYIQLDDDGITIGGNIKLVGAIDVGGTGADAMVLAVPFQSVMQALVAALNAVTVTAPVGAALQIAMTAWLAVGKSMAKSAPAVGP